MNLHHVNVPRFSGYYRVKVSQQSIDDEHRFLDSIRGLPPNQHQAAVAKYEQDQLDAMQAVLNAHGLNATKVTFVRTPSDPAVLLADDVNGQHATPIAELNAQIKAIIERDNGNDVVTQEELHQLRDLVGLHLNLVESYGKQPHGTLTVDGPNRLLDLNG